MNGTVCRIYERLLQDKSLVVTKIVREKLSLTRKGPCKIIEILVAPRAEPKHYDELIRILQTRVPELRPDMSWPGELNEGGDNVIPAGMWFDIIIGKVRKDGAVEVRDPSLLTVLPNELPPGYRRPRNLYKRLILKAFPSPAAIRRGRATRTA